MKETKKRRQERQQNTGITKEKNKNDKWPKGSKLKRKKKKKNKRTRANRKKQASVPVIVTNSPNIWHKHHTTELLTPVRSRLLNKPDPLGIWFLFRLYVSVGKGITKDSNYKVLQKYTQKHINQILQDSISRFTDLTRFRDIDNYK